MRKILGFIPCRSGSKRIVDKNLEIFNSKSLINNIYAKAELSKYIDDIVISTDSFAYLESVNKGIKYIDIGLRSIKNSSDEANDKEVLYEVIKKLEKKGLRYDYVVHLRPTYPALLNNAIDDAIRFLNSFPEATSLKSVEKLDLLYQKCLIEDPIDSSKLISLNGNIENTSMPSQYCNNLYAQTAAIDIYKTRNILEGNLWGDHCLKYEFGNISADINDYFDFIGAYGSLDQFELINKIKKREIIEICFDIDGVIFSRTANNNYSEAIPNKGVIKFVKLLHAMGFKIILHTARGSKTGINWENLTRLQLRENDIPFNKLIFGKPGSEFYIDDRSISIKKLKDILNL